MNRLFTLKNGLLLLGSLAALGAIFLMWFNQPDPYFDEVLTETSREEAKEPGGRIFSPDEPESIESELITIDLVSPVTERASDSSGTAPERLPNNVGLPIGAERSAADRATFVYETKWDEFIRSMDLADEHAVRDIIIDWELFNLELLESIRRGDLDMMEVVDDVLKIEDLQSRLALFLTRDQLVDIAVNENAFSSFAQEQSELMSAELDALGWSNEVLQAVQRSDMDATRALLQSGADVNFMTNDSVWTPLNQAIFNDDVDMAAFLLDEGADLDFVNTYGFTSLMSAARDGKSGMVRLLASRGADMEITSGSLETTALTQAARYNHTDVVRELLYWGADATGRAGRIAIHWARQYGNQEIQRMLQEAGAG